MDKRDLIIAILATFCLTSTLFMMLPTKSETPVGTYDPWVDLNEDGSINLLDAITQGNHFLTSGDSTKNVSVTNWPAPGYNVTKVTINMSASSGQYVFTPRLDCGGYSRISALILPTNANAGVGRVTIYLCDAMWLSTGPYANEPVDSNVFNTTVSGPPLSYYAPYNFMTETKGPSLKLAFGHIDQSLPADWWVTFDLTVYMRNE